MRRKSNRATRPRGIMEGMVAPTHVDPGSGVTPYDRMAFTAGEVATWLDRGEHAAELRLMFGAAGHDELVELARRARAGRSEAGDAPRVWVVPGIMGSQLSVPRDHGLPPDLIWLDALDIIVGRLTRLRVGAEPRLRPSGVLLPTYLRLGLRLQAAGYAVKYFDYDWRLDLARAGRRFAAALRRDARPAAIVAHSLGGLVTRIALARHEARRGAAPISRVVFLGTPQSGSYAAVQALRGSYAVVRKLAMLDRHHDAETLARDVFHSFASLHQLLPTAAAARGTDFFDLANWPQAGLGPDASLLGAARPGEPGVAMLPADDPRCAAIAGIGTSTVVAAQLARGAHEFRYEISDAGDGTVPLDSARLGPMPLWFTRTPHSDLPRDAGVAAATIDLLATGGTTQLPARYAGPAAAARFVTDSDLRAGTETKVDWHGLDADQRRRFLERLNELP